MLIIYPYIGTIKDNDLIALVKDDEFIGYCKAVTVMDSNVLLEVENRAAKILNKLNEEGVCFTLELMT
jgi:hypothetical protein